MFSLEDKFHDECAVIGVLGPKQASNYCYLGLYSMQHRGQEGAGIASADGKLMKVHRDVGLVSDVFDSATIGRLKGTGAIGHTRYATFGGKDWQNLQPFYANFSDNAFAIAHNGNLVNAGELRVELEKEGAIFSTTSDTEVILHLIARSTEKTLPDKIVESLKKVRGAYSLVILTLDKLYAVRDPSGVRPLSIGKIADGYVAASETCAFDLIGAEFIRDVKPGELLEISTGAEPKSIQLKTKEESAFCVFEYVYFARPDSVIDQKSVYQVRKNLGVELAKESPADVDLVIAVPDSGVPAAIGYAEQSKVPHEMGLIRNHYVGRTFIEPKQEIRDFGVKLKLNANKKVLEGKRIAVVDDSLVRGTTCKKIIKMLRDAGASEIHFRISSPPTISPCFYGIDTPTKDELIAANSSIEEIKKYIDADSISYLSLEGMFKAVGEARSGYCDACFSANYKLGQPKQKIAANCVESNQPGK